jgi:long-chain acyl-CoA synthetase
VRRDTLIDFFDDLARADGEFLVYDDGFRTRAFSYQEVGRLARALASRLQSDGLTKGDKAIFYSENRPEWIIAFWACLLNGIVVVPIDFRSSPAFLHRVRQIVQAKLILIGQEVPPLGDTAGVPVWRLAG